LKVAGTNGAAFAGAVIANVATSIIINASIENETVFLFTFFTSPLCLPRFFGSEAA
jgi:hypothetical protein